MLFAVRKATTEIGAAKGTVLKVQGLLDKEGKRNDDLKIQLAILKEKIKEAREKAAKVRLLKCFILELYQAVHLENENFFVFFIRLFAIFF